MTRWLLLVALFLDPVPGATPPAALPASTRAALQSVVDAPQLARGFVGALAVAVGTRPSAAIAAGSFGLVPYEGNERPELFAYNADRAFTPASSLKLFTAAAGLDCLGAGYRFFTRVVSSTAPANGNVPDLYLVGGGDPGLTYDDLRELAAAVRRAGVRRVDGDVLGDATRYTDPLGNGWTVDDLPWYYAAEVSALTLARNQVDVRVAPGPAIGAPATVTIAPANRYLSIDSQVTTVAPDGRTAVTFDRPPGGRAVVLRGAIARDHPAISEGMAVPGVDTYAATVFADCLASEGISVGGQPGAGTAPASTVELASHPSEPLGTLLLRLLKNSDNLYAELLLREIGVKTAGQGSPAGGLHGVRAFLAEAGIATDGLRIEDGSGLSRYNLVTPRAVAGVLRAMAFGRERETFYAALPIAGVDGTLRRRMGGTAAERSVRAKTGFLSNNTALCGYVTTRAGDLVVAATFFNHFLCPTAEARALHDRFFVALAESARP